MKSKLLGVALAAALAVGVAGVAPARPANAALGGWWDIIINAVVNIASRSGGGSDPGLEAAKREIIAAIDGAKQEILDHVDAIAAADVQACTEAAVTKVAQIDSLPPSLLGPFVNGAVDCAALSVSYFNAVQNLGAADNIGKLMGVIYSIAMAGFTKYGLSTADLLAGLIRGYEAVVVKLTPTSCVKKGLKEPGYPREKWWECTAYNGDTGESEWVTAPNEPSREQAEDRATRNTSRALAKDALPRLRAVG